MKLHGERRESNNGVAYIGEIRPRCIWGEEEVDIV
jgi:hypothetical protein